MALLGLRPFRETSSEGLAPEQSARLSGAYQIFAQEIYDKPDVGQKYYGSKWTRFPAGEYTISMIANGFGGVGLEGTVIADNVSNGGSWTTPTTAKFSITANAVIKFDIWYTANATNEPAYFIYVIYDSTGEVFEVSRANEYIGNIVPIEMEDMPPRPPFSVDNRLQLPVFLPKPNWKDGVVEGLSWLTDVLQSETGAEQRRRLREQPRQHLTASFASFGVTRNLIDGYLTAVGPNEGLVPLWFYEEVVDNKLTVATVEVLGDFKDIPLRVNDTVIIREPYDMLAFELNVIKEYSDNKIVLRYGLQRDFILGSTITPMRQSRVELTAEVSQLTDQVSTTQLQFSVTEDPTIFEMWDAPVYKNTGLRVFTMEPNFRDIAFTYGSNAVFFDGQVGGISMAYPGGQAQQWERLGFHINGREDMRKFVEMIHTMNGRWKSFHLPTYRDEFELIQDINTNDGALRVHPSGYTLYGQNSQNTRKHIMIELFDGRVFYNTIISSRTMRGEEWLFLAETLPNIAMSDVRRVCYMPITRLDIDSIEFQRLTDSRGVSTVTLVFVNIPMERTV